jgi:general secretion pathway protein D
MAHPDGGNGDIFEVVQLKYADVSEVVGLLTAGHSIKPNDNFTPEEPAFGSAGMQGSFAGGGPGLSGSSFNQGLNLTGIQAESIGQTIDETIGVDRRLNAIILRGSPARVAKLKEQIVKLDVAVNSVVFETVFVELTETGARNLGLNFNNGNNQITNVTYSFAHGGLPGVTNTSPDGGVGFNLQLAIAAQIAKGNGRIISKPRIAAQSGASAKIITGDALPILTSIALSGVNAVQQQVQYVNVGVTLQIAPRVSDDGFVTSHVFAEVSSVTGVSQGYPTISQREASTSATVRDGDSFIIGGLTQESELTNHNKLPGLGDIPLLGELFNAESSSKTKTDLYIVVTPHVVRGRDGGAEILRGAGKAQ